MAKFHKSPAQRPSVWGPRGPGGPGVPEPKARTARAGETDKPKKHEFYSSEPAEDTSP